MLAECQHARTIGTKGVQVATLTIRNVPDDVVARIERAAIKNGRTIEHEVRELLITQYSSKEAAIDDFQGGATCDYPGEG